MTYTTKQMFTLLSGMGIGVTKFTVTNDRSDARFPVPLIAPRGRGGSWQWTQEDIVLCAVYYTLKPYMTRTDALQTAEDIMASGSAVAFKHVTGHNKFSHVTLSLGKLKTRVNRELKKLL